MLARVGLQARNFVVFLPGGARSLSACRCLDRTSPPSVQRQGGSAAGSLWCSDQRHGSAAQGGDHLGHGGCCGDRCRRHQPHAVDQCRSALSASLVGGALWLDGELCWQHGVFRSSCCPGLASAGGAADQHRLRPGRDAVGVESWPTGDWWH